MKDSFFTRFLAIILVLTLCQLDTFAEDTSRWPLPENAKARIGKGWITEIQYSPDNTRLAVASTIGVWMYDARSGEELSLLTGHTRIIRSISFSPDGQTLASGSEDNTIRLWDAVTGNHKTTLIGHTKGVVSVSFSPDGRTLASGSWDNTIRLWDAVTGNHKTTLTGHRGLVFSVAFSPDGQTLASGGYDGTMILWDITSITDTSLSFLPSPVQSPAIGQTTEPQRFIAPQRTMTPSYYVPVGGNNTLSFGGMSVGFHTELGTNAPFIGVFGYHRQPVTFTYTGQPQTVNLGWLGGVEYTDASWGDSYLGINTKVDAEIFLVTGMIGTDIQSPSGVLTVGAGFALHAMDLGVGVELFGIEVKGSDEYNGITPTALIAYTFHTVTGGPQEGAATFYARYQGQGFMVGVSLGIISFD